ncbi:MAG: hypothetical protein HOC23_10350 [Halieaceae bacterium]|nr:hypothetical protein [Halieaceae bacterium]
MRHLETRVLAAITVVVATLAGGFFWGQETAFSSGGIEPEVYRTMKAALPEAERQIEALRRHLEVVSGRFDVNSAELELLRKEIVTQKEQIASLKEGLAFYKSLMVPGEIAQGLSVRGIELVATEEGGRFSYRIVAQQEARKHDTLKGSLSAELLGQEGGEQVTYPLAALSEGIDDNELVLRFRYFQSIEGELILPEGFEPQSVSIVARSTRPRKAEVRELFPWQVQERFTHVGR